METDRQVHDEYLRQRIESDLQVRLTGATTYEVIVDPYGPDDVTITYIGSRYQIRVGMSVGFDERQYALTIDYVVEWIGDHQDDLAYKSKRPDAARQSHSGRQAGDTTKPVDSQPPQNEPKEQAVELNSRGYYLAEAGKWTEAIPFYKQALTLDPNHLRAWTNLGNALFAIGQLEEALHCHERSLAIDPSFDLAWSNKAVALSGLGRLEDAIICYERALTINPYNVTTRFNKGSVLAKAGRYDEALACYDYILDHVDSRYYLAILAKGEILERLGRLEQTLACINQALTIDVNDEQIWRWKAKVLSSLGQLAEAMAAIEGAIKLDSRQSASWHEKGFIFYKLENFAEAVTCFELTIDLEPTNALAWFNKGAALAALNRYREARLAFTEAERLGHPEASQALAECGRKLQAATSAGASSSGDRKVVSRLDLRLCDDAGAAQFFLTFLQAIQSIQEFHRYAYSHRPTERDVLLLVKAALTNLPQRGVHPAEGLMLNALVYELTGSWLLDEPHYAEHLSEHTRAIWKGLAYLLTWINDDHQEAFLLREFGQTLFDQFWPIPRNIFVTLDSQGRLGLRTTRVIDGPITAIDLRDDGRHVALSLYNGEAVLCQLSSTREDWARLLLCVLLESHFRLPLSQRYQIGQTEYCSRYGIGGIIHVGPHVLHVTGAGEDYFYDHLPSHLLRYLLEHGMTASMFEADLKTLLMTKQRRISQERFVDYRLLQQAGLTDANWPALQSFGIGVSFAPPEHQAQKLSLRLQKIGQTIQMELAQSLR